ncbi:MAG TPA: murein biosynthesis integral membrane protein MurJ [Planctomycetota bacterium]|nr:murein biosynthesis integral membrane protein MurJ [Planctomycetota bacterium]
MSLAGRRFLFTGGGTGGHVTPNLALIGEIRARDRSASVLYLGSSGGYEREKLRKEEVPLVVIPCAQFVSPRRPLKFARMLATIAAGVLKAAWHVWRFKPDVVVATGGYVSVPPVLAAWLLRRRIFLHEQNARPGAANRFLARFASRVGVTFARTLDDFPPPKGRHFGYPVRGKMHAASREAARERYGIAPGKKVVFALGGSMGARSVNRGVAEALPALLKDDGVAVIHSTGLMSTPEYHAYEDTVERLKQLGLGPDIPGRYVCRRFFDDIHDVYALADLVIARSGAGVVMELGAVGKPAVLIPKSDAPGGHQLENAAVFEEAGAAEIFIEEPSYEDRVPMVRVYGDALAKRVLALLADEDLLLRMGRAAARLTAPDAASRCVDELEILAEGPPPPAFERRATRVGVLLDDAGRSHELVFESSVVSPGALADVRSRVPGRRERAVVQRRRNPDGVEFFVLPRSGVVQVNGRRVDRAHRLATEDVVDVGPNRFTFRVLEREIEVEERPLRFGRKAAATFFGTSVSRVFGLLRETAATTTLGLGLASDVMAVALRVSNFFRAVFAETATDSAFLPAFVQLLRGGRREAAKRLFSTVLKLSILGGAAVSVAAILTMPTWIEAIYRPKAPDAATAARALDDAVRVTRIMFPYLVLVSVAALLSATLRAFDRYLLPAYSSIFFTVGMLGGFAFYDRFGVVAIGWGVLAGGVGQILVQLPPFFGRDLRRVHEFRVTPGLDFANPGMKRVGRVAPNVLADTVITRAGDLVDGRLASPLGVGYTSALYFGRTLFQLPFALVSQTINTVMLKELSEGLATRDREWTRRLLVNGVNWNVFLLFPISVGMALLAAPLVELLFQYRRFDASDARAVAQALQCYSMGLLGWGLVALTGRFFAARGRTGAATLVNLGALFTQVALALFLVPRRGFVGIALATTATYSVAAVVRLLVLNAQLKEEDAALRFADCRGTLTRTVLATGAAAVAASLCLAALDQFAAFPPFLNRLFRLAVPAFFGAAAFSGAAFLLQSEQFDEILARLGRGRRHDAADPPVTLKPRPVVPQWLAPARLLEWVERNGAKAQRVDLGKRIAMLLEQPRWQDRNIGVKLAGLLKLRGFRSKLCAMATDRRPARLAHRLLGGDFREPGFVRRNALLALARLSEPDEMIVDTLLKALDDPYFEARAAAAKTAGALAPHLPAAGRLKLVARLVRTTEESCFETAANAAQSLGRLADDDSALAVLRTLHYHPNWRVRDAAVDAYVELFRRGVVVDRERLNAALDDVLATCEDFRPRFPLKERLLEARRTLRPAPKEGAT